MRIQLTCTLVTALAVLGCGDVSAPLAQKESPQLALAAPARVTGAGHLERDLGEGPELTTFSYNAIVGPNGASGQFQFEFRAANLKVHGYVTCVTFADNIAWLGGVIARLTSDDPADQSLVGTDIWWRVVDNGQGEGASPDLTTSLLFTIPGVPITAASWCADQPTRGLQRPIQAGNIQVQP